MESSIVVTIAVQPQVEAEAFETFFRESVKKIRAENFVSENVTFSLYKPAEADQKFVWITRFPEEELNRVSRCDWPFVILAMLDMLRDIQGRFATNVSVVSSSVLTAEGLVDQWNERHGRFKRCLWRPRMLAAGALDAGEQLRLPCRRSRRDASWR